MPDTYRRRRPRIVAIFPILIERRRSNNSDGHGRLANALAFGRVEAKPHTRGQIQTVVGRIVFPARKPPPQMPR